MNLISKMPYGLGRKCVLLFEMNCVPPPAWQECTACQCCNDFLLPEFYCGDEEMSTPGVEPGLSRPQRDVLTTRRCGQVTDQKFSSYFLHACRNWNLRWVILLEMVSIWKTLRRQEMGWDQCLLYKAWLSDSNQVRTSAHLAP